MVELEEIDFFGGLNWIGRDRLCRGLVAGSLDGTSRGPTSSPLLAAQKSCFFSAHHVLVMAAAPLLICDVCPLSGLQDHPTFHAPSSFADNSYFGYLSLLF